MKSKKYVRLVQYLDTGIFPFTVLFSVGHTYKQLRKQLKKAKGWQAALSNNKELVCNKDIRSGKFAIKQQIEGKYAGTYFFIILTNCFGFSDEEICELAHEVLHICQFSLRDALDTEREYECFAYLHTHLMAQCLKHLRYKPKK